jgi:hypothetical protein
MIIIHQNLNLINLPLIIRLIVQNLILILIHSIHHFLRLNCLIIRLQHLTLNFVHLILITMTMKDWHHQVHHMILAIIHLTIHLFNCFQLIHLNYYRYFIIHFILTHLTLRHQPILWYLNSNYRYLSLTYLIVNSFSFLFFQYLSHSFRLFYLKQFSHHLSINSLTCHTLNLCVIIFIAFADLYF